MPKTKLKDATKPKTAVKPNISKGNLENPYATFQQWKNQEVTHYFLLYGRFIGFHSKEDAMDHVHLEWNRVERTNPFFEETIIPSVFEFPQTEIGINNAMLSFSFDKLQRINEHQNDKSHQITFSSVSEKWIFTADSNSTPVLNEIIFMEGMLIHHNEQWREECIENACFSKKQIENFFEETGNRIEPNNRGHMEHTKDIPFKIIRVNKKYECYGCIDESWNENFECTIEFVPDFYSSATRKIMTEKKL